MFLWCTSGFCNGTCVICAPGPVILQFTVQFHLMLMILCSVVLNKVSFKN